MHRWGGSNCFPSIITVFSAPNYCGEYHNKGAVILIEEEKMNIKQYKEVPHPFHLPGNIDLFEWSVPFLMEKVMNMLNHVTTKMADDKKQKKIEAPTEDKDVDVDKILKEQKTITNETLPISRGRRA